MSFNPWKAAGAALLLGLALNLAPGGSPAQAESTSPQGDQHLTSGIDRADLDPTIDPTRDFFDYATGGWRQRHPIPDDQSTWGTFYVLRDRNTQIVRDLLVEATRAPEGSLERKLGDFYASGMDEGAIEKAGLAPIREDLQALDKLQERQALQAAIIRLHRQGVDPYFSFFSSQDDKDSTRMIGVAWQGGLGLPERDYYLRTDEESGKIRDAYRAHVTKMFTLLGDSAAEAAREAEAVLSLETRLARASLPAAELRDPENVYHLMGAADFQALTPAFSWPRYFEGVNLPSLAEINVAVPGFLEAVNRELAATPLADHRSYLRWHLVDSFASFLPSEFEQEHFHFNSTVLRGVEKMKPRWKRVSETVDAGMGMGLGELYVRRYFPPEAKARVLQMVENLKAAMAADIPTLTWMSPATQKAALEKLASFRAKIGYPDRWRDYSSLEIDRNDYLGNVRRARMFEVRRDFAKIGKPVDRDEWQMSPQTVNAYYNPSMNEIVFPAGILQPPFFDVQAEDAVNYGAIGMVIGHEISHGFDDQGSKYDGQGNLRNWWSPGDLEDFQQLAAGVEKQFASYEAAGLKLNGKLVLGEAIADLSGLQLAWMAYQRAQEGRASQVLDGFTPAQRFFLGYARVWATNMRPEMERLQVNTDPHPHPRWRVNGPLSNMPEFFQAFGVKDGDPMARPVPQRNRVW
jgi:putative endopeptidase